jgi:hypothetical protein
MIDVTKIFKRAWKILWSYRALWLIGLVLALTTAGTMPNNNNSNWREDARGWQPGQNLTFPTGETLRDAWDQMRQEINRGITWENFSSQEWNTLLWIIVGIVVAALALGVVMTIARYVSETSVIRMVDEYERTGQKVSLRQGLRYGWSRTAWRLFLINLLVILPIVIMVASGLLIGVGIFFLVSGGSNFFSTTGVIAAIGLFFLLIFLGVILVTGVLLLRDLFWRACALEEVGVGEALRLGWRMVRQNWKSVGLTWLVLIAVRIAWSIALVLAFFLILPLLVVTVLAGLVVGGLPGLLVGGLSSLFLGGPLPWIVGAIVGLPFFLVVAFSPLIFLRGLVLVYNSTVWTLTYRELNALQSLAPQSLPADDLPDPTTGSSDLEPVTPGE